MTNYKKPPYRVPSMQQIANLPHNGFYVVSTFSGCGGSCLGYRMAGYKVLWASEFIPAAQKVYKDNHPDSILDIRDIRDVKPQEILSATNKDVGEIDILDGSPPCSAFSTAGKREKGWGQIKKYSDSKQRVDNLFFEYARILKGLQPKVFVAENVSGLVKGKAKGCFLNILKTLKNCDYNVKAKVLDAQWLGVPQMRQRLIFIGVRNDLELRPIHPLPLKYRYTVKDAIPWIVKIKKSGKPNNYQHSENPSPTIMQSDANRSETAYLSGGGWVEAESDISKYAIGKEWEKLRPGEAGKSKYINLSRASVNKPSFTVTQAGGNSSAASVTHPTEKRKFSIEELKRICAFPDDFVLTGTYAQQWERLGRAVPPVMMMYIAKTIQKKILNKIDNE